MVKKLFYLKNGHLHKGAYFSIFVLFFLITGVSLAQEGNCGVIVSIIQTNSEVEIILENSDEFKVYLIDENKELINVDNFDNNKIKGLLPGKYLCLIEGNSGCQEQRTFIVKRGYTK